MDPKRTSLDLLAVGELLVDLISIEYVENLRSAAAFQKLAGGSPANLAVNVARLGGKAALVARAGQDGFGQFLVESLAASGVDTRYLALDPVHQTSLVCVARTTGTPDFLPYRSADFQLFPEDIPGEALEACRILHTTTWPLSRQPSRSAVLDSLQVARSMGKIVSLDPNFSPKVWPDVEEARRVLRQAFRSVGYTKFSLDDASRLLGSAASPEETIQRIHELGPAVVVLTLGKDGSMVSRDGTILERLPARPIQVVDATGAGDSFWAGFLVALVEGLPLEKCLRFAREVVEIKLQTLGPLPAGLSKEQLLQKIMP